MPNKKTSENYFGIFGWWQHLRSINCMKLFSFIREANNAFPKLSRLHLAIPKALHSTRLDCKVIYIMTVASHGPWKIHLRQVATFSFDTNTCCWPSLDSNWSHRCNLIRFCCYFLYQDFQHWFWYQLAMSRKVPVRISVCAVCAVCAGHSTFMFSSTTVPTATEEACSTSQHIEFEEQPRTAWRPRLEPKYR